MNPSWCVVIPSDNEEHLALSVQSVLDQHSGLNPFNICIVTRTLRQDKVRKSLRDLTYIIDHSEFCFSRRINLGFQAMHEQDVVIMGDDVEVATPNAFEIMRSEAPLRLLAASVRGRIGPWWQKEGETHPEVPFISFTCVYVPRFVYELVGPMDERFPGYGFDDTDYCIRARRLGLSCGVMGNVVIEHSVRIPSSFVTVYKDEMGELEARAKQAFQDKWKESPR